MNESKIVANLLFRIHDASLYRNTIKKSFEGNRLLFFDINQITKQKCVFKFFLLINKLRQLKKCYRRKRETAF